MYLSATALVLVLRLVAAAPRHQPFKGTLDLKVNFANLYDDCDVNEGSAPLVKSIEAHIHGSEGPENGIGNSFVQVDVSSNPQSILKGSSEAPKTTAERIPGWVFFEGKRFRGRIYGNTYWNIKGDLEENFPQEEFLLDPLVFTFNQPMDFEGPFTGKIGGGEITLKWERSGAMISGRSPIGDFEIKGATHVDWSP